MGGDDETPGQSRITGDVGVSPGLVGGRADLVVRFEELGRLTEVETGLEGPGVGVEDLRCLGEALLDPLEGGLGGTAVEPAQQTEGEEVLRPLRLPGLDPGQLAHLQGERGHRHLVDRVGGQAAVDEGVGGVARLVERTLVEGVDVHDEGASGGHEMTVGLEGGRVHGHEHRWGVPGGEDVVVRDVDLESGHPGQGARRGPDLGREVRKGGRVVAEQGADRGELRSCQLHPVAGVAGEADDDPVELCRWMFCRGGQRSSVSRRPRSTLRGQVDPRMQAARPVERASTTSIVPP